jgi:hypothetical protein
MELQGDGFSPSQRVVASAEFERGEHIFWHSMIQAVQIIFIAPDGDHNMRTHSQETGSPSEITTFKSSFLIYHVPRIPATDLRSDRFQPMDNVQMLNSPAGRN